MNRAKQMNHPIGDERLRGKLSQQLRFMRHSCDYFDNGDEEEALRIATCLRVLFHDTGKSTSICTHLDLTGSTMSSSSRGYGNWQDYLAHNVNPALHQPIWMTPLLGDFFHQLPYTVWWQHESVFVHRGIPYSRRMITLAAADRDGGAHVDKELDHYYEVLANGEYAIGIEGNFTYDGAPPFPQGVMIYPKNAHLALLRQFAHETFASFARLGLWEWRTR